ncbi:MAG: shikimate kinase [Gemmatales bacterium]
MNNLYLIGYRGVGKTTLAPLLAAKLGWPVVELDDLIEQQERTRIVDIFKHRGEACFRDLESAMLQIVAGQSRQVVSTGGGIILREENRQLLRSTGQVVWLQASAELIYQRLMQDNKTLSLRPALTSLPMREEIKQLINARSDWYASTSHFSVDTESHKLEEIVSLVLQHLDQR